MAEASSSSTNENKSKGFYVCPKKDCQHVAAVVSGDQKIGVDVNEKCAECGNKEENWLCLTCSSVLCSRYVNEHMLKHNEITAHPITISYADISVWCYACDSYIESPLLQGLVQAVTMSKFQQ
eukprot:gene6092-6795_t